MNDKKIVSKVLFVLFLGGYLMFLANEASNCDGAYVRGVFSMVCIEGGNHE